MCFTFSFTFWQYWSLYFDLNLISFLHFFLFLTLQTLKLIFFKFYIIIFFECIFSPSFALSTFLLVLFYLLLFPLVLLWGLISLFVLYRFLLFIFLVHYFFVYFVFTLSLHFYFFLSLIFLSPFIFISALQETKSRKHWLLLWIIFKMYNPRRITNKQHEQWCHRTFSWLTQYGGYAQRNYVVWFRCKRNEDSCEENF